MSLIFEKVVFNMPPRGFEKASPGRLRGKNYIKWVPLMIPKRACFSLYDPTNVSKC